MQKEAKTRHRGQEGNWHHRQAEKEKLDLNPMTVAKEGSRNHGSDDGVERQASWIYLCLPLTHCHSDFCPNRRWRLAAPGAGPPVCTTLNLIHIFYETKFYSKHVTHLDTKP